MRSHWTTGGAGPAERTDPGSRASGTCAVEIPLDDIDAETGEDACAAPEPRRRRGYDRGFERAVAEGEIAPVDTAAVAHVLAGLGREFARPEVAEIAQASPKQTADAISEIILQGLLAKH